MGYLNRLRSVGENLLLPIFVWALIILVFLNVKNIPFSLSEKDHIVLRYLIKFMMTILFPMGLIYLFHKGKSDYGIYFPKFSESFRLSLRAYAIGGPAGISFWIISAFGWTFADWPGTILLSAAYLLVFYFVPKISSKLPSRLPVNVPNNRIFIFMILSFASIVFAYFTYEDIPVLSMILYYIFIVGFGEELLFRGYFQSAFNRFFGKPFQLQNVDFGWGLIVSAVLFGLMHSLVVVPPNWPWALFTFVIGLTLGYLREKDGSVLAAILLHAMLDMPLIFMT